MQIKNTNIHSQLQLRQQMRRILATTTKKDKSWNLNNQPAKSSPTTLMRSGQVPN
jgi:hypothetical protein